MAKDFPYCRVNENTLVCDCTDPCLQITLLNAGNSIVVTGLVDSGCSTTLVSASLAPVLGIDLSVCPTTQIQGVGAVSTGWMSEIEFQVDGFDSFQGHVIFVEDLPVPALLGQVSFFDNFDIHFRKSSYCFTLEKVK